MKKKIIGAMSVSYLTFGISTSAFASCDVKLSVESKSVDFEDNSVISLQIAEKTLGQMKRALETKGYSINDKSKRLISLKAVHNFDEIPTGGIMRLDPEGKGLGGYMTGYYFPYVHGQIQVINDGEVEFTNYSKRRIEGLSAAFTSIKKQNSKMLMNMIEKMGACSDR